LPIRSMRKKLICKKSAKSNGIAQRKPLRFGIL